jgi:hypothetical protein
VFYGLAPVSPYSLGRRDREASELISVPRLPGGQAISFSSRQVSEVGAAVVPLLSHRGTDGVEVVLAKLSSSERSSLTALS